MNTQPNNGVDDLRVGDRIWIEHADGRDEHVSTGDIVTVTGFSNDKACTGHYAYPLDDTTRFRRLIRPGETIPAGVQIHMMFADGRLGKPYESTGGNMTDHTTAYVYATPEEPEPNALLTRLAQLETELATIRTQLETRNKT